MERGHKSQTCHLIIPLILNRDNHPRDSCSTVQKTSLICIWHYSPPQSLESCELLSLQRRSPLSLKSSQKAISAPPSSSPFQRPHEPEALKAQSAEDLYRCPVLPLSVCRQLPTFCKFIFFPKFDLTTNSCPCLFSYIVPLSQQQY